MAQYFSYILVLFFFGTQLCHGAPSAADIDEIVALHNQYRSAKCLQDLKWDTAIATLAQTYSDKCVYAHSGMKGYGENIAYGSGSGVTAKRLAQLWADEIKDYTCGDLNGIYNQGHYTQMMWNTTTLVGCGWTTGCSFGNYLVCNYRIPGNQIGKNPYACPDQCKASSPVTTARLPATTARITTAPVPITTGRTTGKITTGRTTGKITTGQTPRTTGKVTTGQVNNGQTASGTVTSGRVPGRGTTSPVTSSPLTSGEFLISNSNSEEGPEQNIENIDPNRHDDRLIGMSKPAAIGVISAVVIAIFILAVIIVAIFVLKRRRNPYQFENNLIISPPVEPLPTVEVPVQPTTTQISAPSSPVRAVAEMHILPLPPPSPRLADTYSHGSPCAPRYYAKNTPSQALSSPSQSPIAPRFAIGTVCQAMWSGDSQFYRARIDDIQGLNYLVTFLDFGDSQEWVPRLCLRTMRN